MLDDKDFEFVEETPVNENTEVEEKITADDFTLTEVDSSVHEQKFQTKPTTFLKDSLKRFRKNKSSVVAAGIIGVLLAMSFLVPIIDKSDLRSDEGAPKRAAQQYVAPKLFNAGTGWWDGTVTYKKIPVDISEMPNAQTEAERQEHWWPDASIFVRSAISNKKITPEQYSNDLSTLGAFGREGYIQFGYYDSRKEGDYVTFSTNTIPELTLDNDLSLAVFDTYDADKLNKMEGKSDLTIPSNYHLGESAFCFEYEDDDPSTPMFIERSEVVLVDYATVHNIGSGVESMKQDKVNIANIIATQTGKTTFKNANFYVKMVPGDKKVHTCSLIRSIVFESTSTNANTKAIFDEASFTDATKALTKSSNDGYAYWPCTGVQRIYLSKAHFCSFVYDTYDAAFGVKEIDNFAITDLLAYEEAGWVSFNHAIKNIGNGRFLFDKNNFKCTILDPKKCPLAEELTVDNFYGYETAGNLGSIVKVYNYKYLGFDSMPRYLMGTDKSGRDMFKYVFEGLRTSLLIGFIVFVICFFFGLAWGAISGYFGGTVDLVMERIAEIIGRMPGMVVLTLIILHLGSNFRTFIIALCMTGWLGVAEMTRTQFYRFRGREYVLASRTLGASDARLIARHILPNGLGTIITGSVLMIPYTIFSEASIAYLNLGLKNMSSLGVILSDNQSELFANPYLLIFPAVIIALTMISFNLFGNGLRDAVNPSLKGEE